MITRMTMTTFNSIENKYDILIKKRNIDIKKKVQILKIINLFVQLETHIPNLLVFLNTFSD